MVVASVMTEGGDRGRHAMRPCRAAAILHRCMPRGKTDRPPVTTTAPWWLTVPEGYRGQGPVTVSS